MPNYSEYDWIQESIDTTREETEKVRALTKYLKEKETNSYYIFPERLRKNPVEPIFIELEFGNGITVLECRLSEN
ncbi:MAG: hypothetical protein AAB857_02690 [Patescibacteria group bacterium]